MVTQILIFNYMLLTEMIFGHISIMNASIANFILEPLLLVIVALFVILVIVTVFFSTATLLFVVGIGVTLFVISITLISVIWKLTFGVFL